MNLHLPRQKYVFFSLLAILFFSIGALCFWTFKLEPESFQLIHHSIFLKKLPAAHDNLRVALIADIHLQNHLGDQLRLRQVISELNAAKPDLVVLAGDFIGRRHEYSPNAPPETIAAILSELKARYGVFAVLGNHDWWYDGAEVTAELEKVGITVLENRYHTVEINGQPLNLIGLPDRTTRGDTFDATALPPPETPAIILSHDPDYFEELQLPYELMLSGHTHGGQVRLPFLGAMVIPSRYGTKYDRGWFQSEDQRQLFITSGLGTSIFKMRFCCPPEAVLLTLHASR